MIFFHLILYLLAFFALWFAAGLIMSSVDHFSKKLKISSFAFSFFVLGSLTSIPEFAVGMTALAENKPDVFVGNLIGGIPVIFFFIIPILAILGKGIKLQHSLNATNMLLSFVVILAPVFFVLDKTVTNLEGIIMIALYIGLFFFIERKDGLLDTENSKVLNARSYSYKDILKILSGIGLAFIASHVIVDNTLYFANVLHVSTYFISLFVLALGTNLPELSLAVRAIISGRKDIAFGDYIGSAATNTFLFGLFTLINVGEVLTVNHFLVTFIIMTAGLGIFFYLTRAKDMISPRAGFILLVVYAVFLYFNI
jgi:cation:H+ antiporter